MGNLFSILGYLRSYNGKEFFNALESFNKKYPGIPIQVQRGTHEEIFTMLRCESVDLVLNDQRKAFSDEYENLILTTVGSLIEISSRSPLSSLSRISSEELKNTPCILISSESQRETERDYYQTVMGIQGEFIYAEDLEEARILLISGKGFMPVDGSGNSEDTLQSAIKRIPLTRGEKQITRNYCAFWKKDNSGYYVEEFADILKEQYKKQ